MLKVTVLLNGPVQQQEFTIADKSNVDDSGFGFLDVDGIAWCFNRAHVVLVKYRKIDAQNPVVP